MLNNSVKNSPTLEIFKKQIKPYREHNVLYYYGRRWLNIHHARLRLGCSKLNYDLCYNLRVKDSPTCSCGHRFETAEHFLISCPSYDLLRVGLQKIITQYRKFAINVMLYGDSEIDFEGNKIIFDAVFKYMEESRRFN